MVERNSRAALATFFADGPLRAGDVVRLSAGASHHAHVRRLVPGDTILLTDGAGTRASAELARLRRNELEARVIEREVVPRPRAIHLRAPVADRDRMLWLAEKATELGIASWQAVRFRRSVSVAPRGEGTGFAAKLRARMISALEQSGGGWLPEIQPEVEPGRLDAPSGAIALVLDEGGAPILPALTATRSEVAIALGPEGGLEPEELQLLATRGWRSVRVASTTLRFETAGIAAIAVARATTLSEDAWHG